jgi:hypothetical protein
MSLLLNTFRVRVLQAAPWMYVSEEVCQRADGEQHGSTNHLKAKNNF